jgi:predicted ATPase/Tfp pilus assembly protein PilF
MSDDESHILPLADGFVHFGRREFIRGDERIPLSPNESELLLYLSARPAQTVSKKEILREVFGYVEGIRSRTLQTTMQRLRQKVERDAGKPVHLLNVYGKGYRFEALQSMTNENLKSSGGIIGRGHERTQIYEWLETERCVVLLGHGGIGKTSLARVQAQLWRSRGAVWFCDLSTAHSLADVLALLGAALSLKRTRDPKRIGHALRGHGRCLLILDNVEQVEEGLCSWIRGWLAHTEALRVLVTSRRALDLPGEVLPVAPLSQQEARRLFEERAALADPAACLEEDEVDKIVSSLERIPLAIELAAARLTLLSVQEVACGVKNQLHFLRRGASGRHHTMRAAIRWSWMLLSKTEQKVLAQCAVFSGGFPISAIEEVFVSPDAEEQLIQLKAHSLIQVQKGVFGSRFILFESVRAFAQEQLKGSAWREEVEGRHEAWCLATAERLISAEESGELMAMDRLACERANLELAFQRAWEKRAPQAALLALVITPFFRSREDPVSGIPYLDKALSVWPEDGAQEIHAQLYLARGNLRCKRLSTEGKEDIEKALALVRPGSITAAKAQLERGNLYRKGLRWKEAHECYQCAWETLSVGSHSFTRLNLMSQMGTLAHHMGDKKEAETLQRRTLAEARAHGLERAQLIALGELGTLCRSMGRMAEAEGFHREALALASRLGDLQNQTVLLGHLANMFLLQVRFSEAEETYRDALEMEQKYGGRAGIGFVLMNLGCLFMATERLAEAGQHLTMALAAFTEVGNDRAWLHCMTQLGRVRRLQGHFDEADKALTQSIAPKGRQPAPTWFHFCQRAMVRAEQGREEESREDLRCAEGEGMEADTPEAHAYLTLAKTYLKRADILKTVPVDSQSVHLRALSRLCKEGENAAVNTSIDGVLLRQAWRLLSSRISRPEEDMNG